MSRHREIAAPDLQPGMVTVDGSIVKAVDVTDWPAPRTTYITWSNNYRSGPHAGNRIFRVRKESIPVAQ